MNFFPPCLFFPYSLGYLDKINNKTITGTWTSNFPGPMAQRPWPRPCGCQVPPYRGAPARCRAATAGPGGVGRGVRASTPGPHPAFQVLGNFHRDTYSLRQRQPKEGDLPVPILSSPPNLVGRKGKQFSSFVASFAARSWSERLGTAGGSSRRAWGLAVLYFGEKETGVAASERSPPRGEGEAQQTPAPPKCIRWRKSISSGEQIECIKLA